MDAIEKIVTSFPPQELDAATDKQYDATVRSYLLALGQITVDDHKLLVDDCQRILQLIDPAKNSIGYLAVLDIVFQNLSSMNPPEREELLTSTCKFFANLDARQVRYVGSLLLKLLELVANDSFLPPLVRVEILASTILCLDPTTSTFTSTHLALAKVALEVNVPEAALPIIDNDITFFPKMTGSKEPRYLCDLHASPANFLLPTGLTRAITSSDVLEYNVLCSLLYTSQQKWSKAQGSLERVISHPCKEKGTSLVMTESYKRWILIGLLNQGRAPSLPSYTGSTPRNTYTILAKPYTDFATLFSTTNAPSLRLLVGENSHVWEEDGNTLLLARVLQTYQRWQILNLRYIYKHVALSKIKSITLSGETGMPLQDDQEILALIQHMIESGMLKGTVEARQSDGSLFLTFHEDHDLMSEVDFAREILQIQKNIEKLGQHYNLTNERLSTNKDYIKYMAKEQRRLEKEEAEGGSAFEGHFDDEDLMTGIMSHS